jgi:hypothetical protein
MGIDRGNPDAAENQKGSGREAAEEDLTSIDTWMKVDEVEQRKQLGGPMDSGTRDD